jgi:hypothetical protein
LASGAGDREPTSRRARTVRAFRPFASAFSPLPSRDGNGKWLAVRDAFGDTCIGHEEPARSIETPLEHLGTSRNSGQILRDGLKGGAVPDV